MTIVAAPTRFHPIPAASAFILTAVLLGIVQLLVDPPMLLLERCLPGAGWLELFLLALYAAILASLLVDPNRSKRLRPKIWAFFSVVFFGQLLLGLAGAEKMLMTGALHLPVPALIVAGPLFRGGGFFMLILFCATVLLVGPAWCSWLCYIGSWDDQASRKKKKPTALPPWRNKVRATLMILVFAAALLLGRLGFSPLGAALLAGAFGLFGVGLMVFWSSQTGTMTHCTAFCPMGWLATRLGRINPFRIRIDAGCDQCLRCSLACRYDALHVEDIERKRPGESCTLCGDCVSHCEKNQIDYRFLGLKAATARAVFITLVVSLHAVFLGIARM